jgi:hypothetical protein
MHVISSITKRVLPKKRDGHLLMSLLVLVGLTACSPTTTQPVQTATDVVQTNAPRVASSPPAVATRPPTPPPAPAGIATAVPASITVWVGETDGGGVYLRNSPHDGDRAEVLPDGTPLLVSGDEEEGDGQRWYPVKTVDGASGYVQVIYTTRVEPSGPPGPPRVQPK